MNRLKELRTEQGMTQSQLGALIGIKKASISKYENGLYQMTHDIILKICDLFHVSSDYLLGRSDRRTNDPNPTDFRTTTLIPVVGRVHAGLPILADENITEYIESTSCANRSDEFFFMEVEGDCMIGEHIVEGSRVLVRKQSHVENGQIAVVRIEDEVLLRRVKWLNKQLLLMPANPVYEPIVLTSGDVEIIGRVIEVRFFL